MNASPERLGTSATRLILGLLLALLALLAACGGGSGGTDAPAASRIEAGPQSVLLVGVGDSRTLSAQRIDAAGAPLAGAVSWASSDPALVSVDSAGTVRALAGAGSARVTASSGALQSAAVLVTIAQPVAGAQLLADSQVVSGPSIVDAAAEPAAGNAYEVVLRGAPLLTAGTIVIASESANVAGRVVSVQPEGTDQRVRLVAVPPNQLFSSFDFRDSVDLAQGPFEIPADLAATYDVVQTGNTFAFTPKPGTLRSQDRKTAAAATGTSALGPLPPFKECEASADFGSGLPVPLALSAAPSFEVTIDGSARREANPQGTRFIVTGSPKFKLASVLEIKSGFEAKVGCKLTLVTRKFRVPGWAGLFFGGDVEFGVGFEVAGKVTLASAKVGGTVALNSTVEATLNCPAAPGNCTLDGSSSAQTELTPVLQAPALEQAQFEPSVNLFGFVSLEAGNADVQQLQFKAIEIKAGAELAAGLTPEALQIANLDADTGRSKYALAFKGDVGPGVKLGEFLAFVGLAEVVPLKLAFTVDLGASPSATSVVADRSSYLPGERATVTVKLAPASTLFPSGFFYNVERVVLRRTSGPFGTEVLAEQAATAGQTDFTLGFDSAALLNAGDIFAFVVTMALPLDPPTLELAAAQAPPVVVLSAQFPAQIPAPTTLTVTAQVTAGNGQLGPAPNLLVQLAPICATVNPTSGRTDGNGRLSATVTPTAGCSSLSVDVTARAEVGSTALAQTSVTASITAPTGTALAGQLTLTDRRTFPDNPNVVETFVSLAVTVEVNNNGVFTVRETSGTMSQQSRAIGVNNCFVTSAFSGDVVPADSSIRLVPPSTGRLLLSFFGTSTSTGFSVDDGAGNFSCTGTDTLQEFRQTPTIPGRPFPFMEFTVIRSVDGKVSALDFNLTVVVDNGVPGLVQITSISTGRLELP